MRATSRSICQDIISFDYMLRGLFYHYNELHKDLVLKKAGFDILYCIDSSVLYSYLFSVKDYILEGASWTRAQLNNKASSKIAIDALLEEGIGELFIDGIYMLSPHFNEIEMFVARDLSELIKYPEDKFAEFKTKRDNMRGIDADEMVSEFKYLYLLASDFSVQFTLKARNLFNKYTGVVRPITEIYDNRSEGQSDEILLDEFDQLYKAFAVMRLPVSKMDKPNKNDANSVIELRRINEQVTNKVVLMFTSARSMSWVMNWDDFDKTWGFTKDRKKYSEYQNLCRNSRTVLDKEEVVEITKEPLRFVRTPKTILKLKQLVDNCIDESNRKCNIEQLIEITEKRCIDLESYKISPSMRLADDIRLKCKGTINPTNNHIICDEKKCRDCVIHTELVSYKGSKLRDYLLAIDSIENLALIEEIIQTDTDDFNELFKSQRKTVYDNITEFMHLDDSVMFEEVLKKKKIILENAITFIRLPVVLLDFISKEQIGYIKDYIESAGELLERILDSEAFPKFTDTVFAEIEDIKKCRGKKSTINAVQKLSDKCMNSTRIDYLLYRLVLHFISGEHEYCNTLIERSGLKNEIPIRMLKIRLDIESLVGKNEQNADYKMKELIDNIQNLVDSSEPLYQTYHFCVYIILVCIERDRYLVNNELLSYVDNLIDKAQLLSKNTKQMLALQNNRLEAIRLFLNHDNNESLIEKGLTTIEYINSLQVDGELHYIVYETIGDFYRTLLSCGKGNKQECLFYILNNYNKAINICNLRGLFSETNRISGKIIEMGQLPD